MFKAASEQDLQPRPQPASSVGVPWSTIDDSVSVALTSPAALMTVQPWANYKPITARSPKAELQVLPKSPPWKAQPPAQPPVLPAAGMVSKPPILFLPPGAASSSRDAMPAASSGDAMPASSGASSGKPFDPNSEVVGYVPVMKDPTYGLWIQDTVEDENKSKVSLRPMVKNIDGM